MRFHDLRHPHGIVLLRAGVLSDTTRVKPLQAEIAIDVVIPAFNEGSCIEGLLHDVMRSKQ